MLSHLDNVIVFIDDIQIFSKSEDEHLNDLEAVLLVLKKNDVKINIQKSEFQCKSVNYLGYQINGLTCQPDLTRLTNFTKWENPEHVTTPKIAWKN
ncbi:transposable element [Pseudoloma neurophilia]|uniref:Transposable element n=1 Tax=Pseudoloma neurophilia TaxID=146866 RepID=A0A0R0M418_9MICR|nr:transposable element [Pseudoloma neurophilia]